MKHEPSNKRPSGKLRVVGFVQARMTSSRLPGKVLMDVSGKPVVRRIIERLQASREIDEVVLEITTQKEDDTLEALGKRIGVPVHRAENEHLVEAYYDIAKRWNANALVCITGDCPFVDPDLVDELVRIFRKNPDAYDFITNVLPPTWPDGLDIFVYPTKILEHFYTNRATLLYRYPVTFNFSKNPERYRIYNLKSGMDLSSLRWTLDYPEDMDLVRQVFSALLPEKPLFKTADILELLQRKPELLEINADRADPTHGWGSKLDVFLKK